MGKRGPTAKPLTLTLEERQLLKAELARHTTQKRVADRCRILMRASQGHGPTAIASLVGWHPVSVDRLIARFRRERLGVLHDKPRPGRPRAFSPTPEGPSRLACL